MTDNDIRVLAQTNFRGMKRQFGIKVDDRRRHMYVIGKTGMGKSTLLENLIIEDIRAGKGVAVVDPHGDLAEKIIKFVPPNRTNDVVYFNPADTQFPVAFNILESVGEEYKHLVAYGLIGVFKKIWADSWGPRLEYILTNTILGLLDYPGSTLLGVMRMLVDKSYRKKVVSKIEDPVVKTFWTDEFANYSEKFRNEAIAPIQNKVGQFLASSIIRNIVGQSKSTIEMREIMDSEKILIMNLSKGRVGEENSALLGAMMITKLQIAAMSRVDIPEHERKDFYLYVDEFQNFATDSFAGILSEARKYRLNLIMAHQYMEQLGDEVRAAVFGNVGTMCVFRVGAADATELESEFAPQFAIEDIVNINKYNFIMRLMIDGVATEPFSAMGLPPIDSEGDGDSEKIVKVSRERYARPRDIVEDRILRWSGVELSPEQKKKAEEAKARRDAGDNRSSDDALNTAPVETGSTDDVDDEVVGEDLADADAPLQAPTNFIPELKSVSESNRAKPKPTIQSSAPAESAQPSVQLEDASVDVATSREDSSQIPRPKINFMQVPLTADDAVQADVANPSPASKPEPASKRAVENSSVTIDPLPKEELAAKKDQPSKRDTAEKSKQEKRRKREDKNSATGSIQTKAKHTQPKTEEGPSNGDEQKLSEQDKKNDNVSLFDLRKGEVDTVKFDGSQPKGEAQPFKKKRRRRRRKKKSNGNNSQSQSAKEKKSASATSAPTQPKSNSNTVNRSDANSASSSPKRRVENTNSNTKISINDFF